MSLFGTSVPPPDRYHAYLLRIWQAGPDGPWRALVQCIQTGERIHFIDLDHLFAYLLAQTKPDPGSMASESTMYARIYTAHFQDGKLDDAVRLVQERILPAAREQPGFHHLWLLTDPATGKGMIVSLWDTEADRIASESSGFLREQLALLGELVTGPPAIERFAVSSHG